MFNGLKRNQESFTVISWISEYFSILIVCGCENRLMQFLNAKFGMIWKYKFIIMQMYYRHSVHETDNFFSVFFCN